MRNTLCMTHSCSHIANSEHLKNLQILLFLSLNLGLSAVLICITATEPNICTYIRFSVSQIMLSADSSGNTQASNSLICTIFMPRWSAFRANNFFG